MKQNNQIFNAGMNLDMRKFYLYTIYQFINNAFKHFTVLPAALILLLIMSTNGYAQVNWTEDFAGEEGLSSGITSDGITSWTSINASVSGEMISYTNNTGSDFIGVLWETDALNTSCDEFVVSYDLTGSDVVMQYSIDDTNWDDLTTGSSVAVFSGSPLKFRLYANAVANTEKITLDNIIVYEALKIEAVTNDCSCYDSDDGDITVTASCGLDNTYTYSWVYPTGETDPGNSTSTSNAGPGDYTITVTNVNGETASVEVAITEPQIVKFSFDNEKAFDCNNGCNGAFDYTLSGGQDPSVEVTNSSGDVQEPVAYKINFTGVDEATNYQLELDISFETGMDDDFDNVNFTDVDENLLTFWLEEYVSTTSATFWVVIPNLAVGDNEIFMTWGAQAIDGLSAGMAGVMNSGGLNAEIYNGTTDLTEYIVDEEAINHDWSAGVVLGTYADIGAVSIRWEGWMSPNLATAYYGIQTNDGSQLYFDDDLKIELSTNDDVYTFGKTGELTLASSVRITYDFNNNDGIGYAFLGNSIAEPTAFTDLAAIPVTNFYYRNVLTNPPGDPVFSPRYDQLCVDTYTITVSDVCDVPVDKTFTVESDTEYPVIETFPDDYYVDISTYNSANLSDVNVVDEDFYEDMGNWTDDTSYDLLSNFFGLRYYSSEVGPISDFVSLEVSTAFYENIRLEMTAVQSNATWTLADEVRIDVDYDGSGTWTTVYTHTGDKGDAISADVTLATTADLNSDLQVRIYFSTETAGVMCDVSSFKLIADEVIHVVDPSVSGTPTCSDDVACLDPTYVDSDPVWACYDLTDPTLNEFSVEREWTIADGCGNTLTQIQLLSFGTAPEFTVADLPVSLTLDFCNNEPSIAAPTATDVCSSTVVMSWVVKNSDGDTIKVDLVSDVDAVGTDALTGVTFPYDETGAVDLVYTVTWTATDESGMKAEETQDVTIRPIITGTITAADIDNVCEDEDVIFVVTPEGGTGSFDDTSFSLSGGVWADPAYNYTTSFTPESVGKTWTITVTDIDGSDGTVGGCSVDLTSEEFDVHDLIETQGIERE
jgi:hypothetical protein